MILHARMTTAWTPGWKSATLIDVVLAPEPPAGLAVVVAAAPPVDGPQVFGDDPHARCGPAVSAVWTARGLVILATVIWQCAPRRGVPCDFCGSARPIVYVSPGLPGGGHRYCRTCLARRDQLLAQAPAGGRKASPRIASILADVGAKLARDHNYFLE